MPICIGVAANRILEAASRYIPGGHWFEDARTYRDRQAFDLGPFHITPYLVDHSAFDAYALLVEADGRRVFYSGDFRAHGRKAGLVEAIIQRPPTDIDVLFMEGTTIGRAGASEGAETESDLEARFAHAFKATRGLHLVWTSSQNIDRLVTLFRAAKRTGRLLLIDLYTAAVLEATGRSSIPQSWWEDVRLYIPHSQRVHIRRNELFDDLGRHSANRVYPAQLQALAKRAVMLFRPHMMWDHGVGKALDGARLSYSMWGGYLQQEASRRVLAWLEAHGIPYSQIHTSGHASVPDLQRLAAGLAPKRLVPIHSFETAQFGEFFANVERQEDGAWWEV